MTDNAATDTSQQHFAIQKIYMKDISYESPNSPDIFKGEDWQPNMNVQIQSRSTSLADKVFEIVLMVTVTAKLEDDRTAYLAEVQQAGIFNINGFDDENMTYMLGSYCPNILFPYARECLTDLVARGGFPQMVLQPVNFDALLAQQLEKTQQEAEAQSTQ
ncbi:MAG: protein-export chaperone SecB [Granulosicoccaceae bacterium]|jgi:preprotein translocase subunit SecB